MRPATHTPWLKHLSSVALLAVVAVGCGGSDGAHPVDADGDIASDASADVGAQDSIELDVDLGPMCGESEDEPGFVVEMVPRVPDEDGEVLCEEVGLACANADRYQTVDVFADEDGAFTLVGDGDRACSQPDRDCLRDLWTARVDANGQLVHQRRYPLARHQRARDALRLPGGDLVVVGEEFDDAVEGEVPEASAFVARLSDEGVIRYDVLETSTPARAWRVALLPGGEDVLVAASANQVEPKGDKPRGYDGSWDVELWRVALEGGGIVASRMAGVGAAYDVPALIVHPDASTTLVAAAFEDDWQAEVLVRRFDPVGDPTWTSSYTASIVLYGSGMYAAATGDGTVVVSHADSEGVGWLRALDADGNQTWRAELPGLGVAPELALPAGLAHIASSGTVLSVSVAFVPEPHSGVWLTAFSASGQFRWARQVRFTLAHSALAGSSSGLALATKRKILKARPPLLARFDQWGRPLCGDSGVCASLSVQDCDDGNPCTTDDCDAEAGCIHTGLPDDTPCGQEKVCRTGVCTDASGIE